MEGRDEQKREPVTGPPTEAVITDSGPGEPGRRRTESGLRTVGVSIGLGIAAIMVPFLVVLPIIGIVMRIDLPGQRLLVGGLFLVQIVLIGAVGVSYLYWQGFTRQQIIHYLGVDWPKGRDLAVVLGAWFAMLVATSLVAIGVTLILPELLGLQNNPTPAENPAAVAIASNPELIAIGIIGMFLFVGPAEEIMFRGVVQNRLRERFSAGMSIVIAAAIFAGAHVLALAGQDPVGIAMTITILFVPGLGLGLVYEYSGNIVVPALLHGLHNSIILLIVYATAVSDPAAGILG